MSTWVWGVLAASVVAIVAAVVDGALHAVGVDRARTDGRMADPEGAHRALIFARRTALLAAGAAVGVGAAARAINGWQDVVLAGVAVLVADSLARSIGYVMRGRALRAFGLLVRPLIGLAGPVVRGGEALERAVARTLPPLALEEEREATTERFREVVAAEADVSREERALLQGVFSLDDTEVREIMVPRVDIVGIERGTPWSEVLDRVRSSEHARFPAYEATLDQVVGILYAKDLLPAVIADEEPRDGWEALVRPTTFIPATKAIDEQLRDFKQSGTHIAIVVDEYGGTAGLVTIEDILEEIVGEIRDEYDVEEPEVVSEEGRRFWVSGRVTLDELSELVDHDFRREGVTTVGGLMFDVLGRVPRAGESLFIGGFRVVVEQVRRRRVERVYFERAAAFSERESP
ncbi:MAG TPA: hemolysin family protein [Gemmatimonadaceae bacterium]|nr:hemolysin family protein [Gemmatimonadaceae bacterium]